MELTWGLRGKRGVCEENSKKQIKHFVEKKNNEKKN